VLDPGALHEKATVVVDLKVDPLDVTSRTTS